MSFQYFPNIYTNLILFYDLKTTTAKSLIEIGNRPGKFSNKNDRNKTHQSKYVSSSKSVESAEASSPSKPVVPSRSKSARGIRSPRLNVVEAFPFADSEFHAEELLCDTHTEPIQRPATAPTSGQAPSFCDLSPAVRNRLAARAFADYCQGSAALRVSDVPQAMAALGLVLPPDLHDAMLARARVPPGSSTPGPGAWPLADPTMQLKQFQSLLDKYVDQGKEQKIAAHNEAVAQRVRA